MNLSSVRNNSKNSWLFGIRLLAGLTIGFWGAMSISALPAQGSADSASDKIFTDVEPGVRIIGKPSPTAVLGQVLDFALLSKNQFAVVCQDGVKLWDNEKGKVLSELQFDDPIDFCNSLEFSNDKQLLAVSTWSQSNVDPQQSGRVLIFDFELNLKTELLVEDQQGDSELPGLNRVASLAFSPDDHSIALSTSQSLLLFDIDTAEQLDQFQYRNDSAPAARIVFQNNQILALGWRSRLIDLATGEVSPLPKSLSELNQFFFSVYDEATNRVFFSNRNDLKAVRIANGVSESIETIEAANWLEMALSPDGSNLAIVHMVTPDKQKPRETSLTLSIINTTDFQLKHRFNNLPGRPAKICWNETNESLFVAFYMDAGFQELNIDQQQIEQQPNYQLNRPVRQVMLSFDGSRLVGSLSNTQATSWDWSTGESTPLGYFNQMVATSLTAEFLATQQNGQVFKLVKQSFKKNQTSEIQGYPMRHKIAGPLASYFFGLSDSPTSDRYYVLPAAMALDETKSDLQCVILDGLDGFRIQSFELPSHKQTRDIVFERPANSVLSSQTAITCDGKRFAVTESGKLKIIDVETTETVFETEATKVKQLLFSAKGDWLAMANESGVTIFETETGKTLKTIDAPDAMIAYAFSSTELLVASSETGSPVRVFDTHDWKVNLEHSTKTAERVSATISHNGQRIAFALSNCCIELWDVSKLKR